MSEQPFIYRPQLEARQRALASPSPMPVPMPTAPVPRHQLPLIGGRRPRSKWTFGGTRRFLDAIEPAVNIQDNAFNLQGGRSWHRQQVDSHLTEASRTDDPDTHRLRLQKALSIRDALERLVLVCDEAINEACEGLGFQINRGGPDGDVERLERADAAQEPAQV
jgi:hypothetical protein